MKSSTFFDVGNSTSTNRHHEVPQSRTNNNITTPKKSRTVFTKKQILRLEAVFYEKRYLTIKDREELSKSLSLSESQVSDFRVPIKIDPVYKQYYREIFNETTAMEKIKVNIGIVVR